MCCSPYWDTTYRTIAILLKLKARMTLSGTPCRFGLISFPLSQSAYVFLGEHRGASSWSISEKDLYTFRVSRLEGSEV